MKRLRGAIHGRPSLDMRGQIVNGCRFIERVMSVRKGARWRVIAGCNHAVVVDLADLRSREAAGEAPYFCKDCASVRHAARVRAAYREKLLRAVAIDSGERPRLKKTRPPCTVCHDMKHRRPEDLTPCRGCKGIYEPESMADSRYEIMTARKAEGWK